MRSANGSSACSRNSAVSHAEKRRTGNSRSLNPKRRADRGLSLFYAKESVLPMFHILGTY